MKELYYKFINSGYRITTDSRKVSEGDIFLALKGENFDGNDYAMKALESGASLAVVNDDADLPDNPGLYRVKDTFKTLQELAIHHRQHVLGNRHLPVIGLTGTNGKTTTKELTSAVLSKKYNVTATQGNLNNDIGVPLSLLQIRPETQIAVIEMGASHPDDIAKLVRVCQPDYGLITNVGKAHLLGFGSFEGVKAAKGELYNWLGTHEGSVIFLNEDDAELTAMAAKQPCHSFGYGVRYDNAEILQASSDEPYVRIRLGDKLIKTHFVGSYNATNILAALAVGRYFGVPEDDAIKAIEDYIPSNNRSQMTRTGRNCLIVDAYNANPSSMAAALDNFAAIAGSSKTAFLGDMRELGEDSVREHVKVLSLLSQYGLKAVLVGDEFKKAMEQSPFKPEAWFHSSEELASFLESHPVSGNVILLKGSRGIMMEKALPFL